MVASLMGLPLLSVICPLISAKAPCLGSVPLAVRFTSVSFAAVVALLGVALPLNLLSPFALLANEAAGMVIAAASNATGMMEGVIRIREYSVVMFGRQRAVLIMISSRLF